MNPCKPRDAGTIIAMDVALTRRNDRNGSKRTTDGPQTGDEVRPPAEEDGEDPDRVEARQEEKVIRRWDSIVGETSFAPSATN